MAHEPLPNQLAPAKGILVAPREFRQTGKLPLAIFILLRNANTQCEVHRTMEQTKNTTTTYNQTNQWKTTRNDKFIETEQDGQLTNFVLNAKSIIYPQNVNDLKWNGRHFPDLTRVFLYEIAIHDDDICYGLPHQYGDLIKMEPDMAMEFLACYVYDKPRKAAELVADAFDEFIRPILIDYGPVTADFFDFRSDYVRYGPEICHAFKTFEPEYTLYQKITDLYNNIMYGTKWADEYDRLYEEVLPDIQRCDQAKFSKPTFRNFVILNKIDRLRQQSLMRRLNFQRKESEIKYRIQHLTHGARRDGTRSRHMWRTSESNFNYVVEECTKCSQTRHKPIDKVMDELPDYVLNFDGEDWVREDVTEQDYVDSGMSKPVKPQAYDPRRAAWYVKGKPHQPKFHVAQLLERTVEKLNRTLVTANEAEVEMMEGEMPTADTSGGTDMAAQQGPTDTQEYVVSNVDPPNIPTQKITDTSILDTSYYFETVPWSSNDLPGTLKTYQIPNDLFSQIDFAGRGLQNYYTFIRSNVEFAVTVSAPRQAVGYLKMLIDPRAEMRDNLFVEYRSTASNFVHTNVILGGQNVGVVEAPYVELTRVIPLRQGVSFSKLVLYIFNQLRFATSRTINVTVSFKLTNPHVSLRNIPDTVTANENTIRELYGQYKQLGMTDNDIRDKLTSLVVETRTLYQDALKAQMEDANNAKPEMASMIASALGIGNTIVNVARSIKDLAGKQDTPEVDTNDGEAAVTQGPVSCHTLGATASEVYSDFKDVIAIPAHSGEISDIISIPSRIADFNWSSANANGTLLFKIPVAPWATDYIESVVLEEPVGDVAMYKDNSNLSFFSDFFRLWRGTMCYDIEPIVNMFHQGSLYVAFFPQFNVPDGTTVTLRQVINLEHFNLVLESKSNSLYTYKIPYISDTDFKRCIFDNLVDRAKTMPDACIGSILVFVQNPLITVDEDTTETVDVNLYSYADEDFKFVQPGYIPGDLNSSKAPAYVNNLSDSVIFPGQLYWSDVDTNSWPPRTGLVTNTQTVQGVASREIHDANRAIYEGLITIRKGPQLQVQQNTIDNFRILVPNRSLLQLQPQPSTEILSVRFTNTTCNVTYPNDWKVKDVPNEDIKDANDAKPEMNILDEKTVNSPEIVGDFTGESFHTCYSDTTMNIYNLLKRPTLHSFCLTNGTREAARLFDAVYSTRELSSMHQALTQIFYARSGSIKHHIHAPAGVIGGMQLTAYTPRKPYDQSFTADFLPTDYIGEVLPTNTPVNLADYGMANKVTWSATKHPLVTLSKKYYWLTPLIRCRHTGAQLPAPNEFIDSDYVNIAVKSNLDLADQSFYIYTSAGEDFNLHYLTNMPRSQCRYTAGADTGENQPLLQNPPIPGDMNTLRSANDARHEMNGPDDDLDMDKFYDPDYMSEDAMNSYFNEYERELADKTKVVISGTTVKLTKDEADRLRPDMTVRPGNLDDLKAEVKQAAMELSDSPVRPADFRLSSAPDANPTPSLFDNVISSIQTLFAGATVKLSTFKNFLTDSLADAVSGILLKSFRTTIKNADLVSKLVTALRAIYLVIWIVKQVSDTVSQHQSLSSLIFNIGAVFVAGCDSPFFTRLLNWIKSVTLHESLEDVFPQLLSTKIITFLMGTLKIPLYYTKDVFSGMFRGIGAASGRDIYNYVIDKVKKFFHWIKNGSSRDSELEYYDQVMPALIDQMDTWDSLGMLSNPNFSSGKNKLQVDAFMNTCRCVMHNLKSLEADYPSLFRERPAWARFIRTVDQSWRNMLKNNIVVNRPEPIGIALAGDPGTGKSLLATHLLPSFVLPKLGLIERRKLFKQCTYNIPNDPDQKYFDGYIGQPWTVYDDIGATPEGKDWASMINMISTAVSPINQASLESKGMVFVSPFVTVTTNVVSAEGVKGVQDIGAIERRFPFKFKVLPKTAYLKNSLLNVQLLSSHLLDCKTYAEELCILDQAFYLVPFNYKKPWQGELQRPTINFSALVDYICDEYHRRMTTGSKLDDILDHNIEASRVIKVGPDVAEVLANATVNHSHAETMKAVKELAFNLSDDDSEDDDDDPIDPNSANDAFPEAGGEFWGDRRAVVNDFFSKFNEDSNSSLFIEWARECSVDDLTWDRANCATSRILASCDFSMYETFSRFYSIVENADSLAQQYFLIRHFILRAHANKVRGERWCEAIPYHFTFFKKNAVDDFTIGAAYLEIQGFGPTLKLMAQPIGEVRYPKWQGLTTLYQISKGFAIGVALTLAATAFWCALLFILGKIFTPEEEAYSIRDKRAVSRSANKAKREGNSMTDVWGRNMIHFYSTEGYFLLNGYALDNSHVLVPLHLLKSHSTLRISYPSLLKQEKKFIDIEVEPSSYRRLHYPSQPGEAIDLVILELPLALPSIRSSLKHFFTDEEFHKLTAGLAKRLIHHRSLGKMNMRDVSCIMVGKYHRTADLGSLGFVTYGQYVEYGMTDQRSKPGVCGTPYSYNNKIMGFHVLGQAIQLTSYYAPITRETISAALATFNTDPEFSISIETDVADAADLECVTCLPNPKGVNISVPSKTDFVHGYLRNEDYGDGHAPPSLSHGALVEEEQAKFCVERDIFIPGPRCFRPVSKNLEIAMYKDANLKVSRVPEYSILNGDDELGMAPMDIDTSAGFWRCNGKGKHAILDYTYTPFKVLSIKEEVFHNILQKTLRQDIVDTETDYIKGIRTDNDFWQSSLKDELRKVGKTPRAFECSSFKNTYLAKKYLGDFVSTYRKRAGPRLGHAIGTDRNQVWGQIYSSLSIMGDGRVVDLDYSKYDGSIGPLFFHLFLKDVQKYYAPCKDSDGDKIRAAIIHELQHSFHVLGNEIFMSHKGNKSGSWLTDAFNSYVNNYLIRSAFYYSQFEEFDELEYDFNKCVCIYTYGDDVILAIHRTVQDWFSLDRLTSYIRKLGFNVTSADKSDNICYKPISESTFLKSGFEIRDQVVLAPLPITIIYREINWMKKCSFKDPSIYSQRLLDALRFSVHHGRETFQEIYDYIIQHNKRFSFNHALLDLDYDDELDKIATLQRAVTINDGFFSYLEYDNDDDVELIELMTNDTDSPWTDEEGPFLY